MIPLYAYASHASAPLDAPLGPDAVDAVLRPSTTSAANVTNERVRAFERALVRARREATSSDPIQPPRSMAQLMRTLVQVNELGEPAPGWLVATVRAAGIDTLADTLEARNRRMQQERHAGRAEAASHTG
ncbi:MAG: hypothetical protein JWM98_2850 [Thermoleophilia bacterium]|nr:hypothetical protein [Thermoleophilia bacterium]